MNKTKEGGMPHQTIHHETYEQGLRADGTT
jgi:hypothetical protein